MIMVTLKEAAVIYGVTVRTMREWIKNGKVYAYKLENGRWMVGVQDENKDR